MAHWHDRIWTLQASLLGTPIQLRPQAANTFKLVPSKDLNQNIAVYTIEAAAEGSIAPGWVGCRLVPQGGVPLTKRLPEGSKLDPASPSFRADLKALIQDIRDNKIDDVPFVYERLVGTVQFNTQHHPLTFYQVANVFKGDPQKALLIVDVNVLSGSPGGVVGGNN